MPWVKSTKSQATRDIDLICLREQQAKLRQSVLELIQKLTTFDSKFTDTDDLFSELEICQLKQIEIELSDAKTRLLETDSNILSLVRSEDENSVSCGTEEWNVRIVESQADIETFLERSQQRNLNLVNSGLTCPTPDAAAVSQIITNYIAFLKDFRETDNSFNAQNCVKTFEAQTRHLVEAVKPKLSCRSKNDNQFSSNLRPNSGHFSVNSIRAPYCFYCSKSDHFSDKCHKFNSLKSRYEQCKKKRVCVICLKKNHSFRNCRNRQPCFYCKLSNHHRSLCKCEFLENSNSLSAKSDICDNFSYSTIGHSNKNVDSNNNYFDSILSQSDKTDNNSFDFILGQSDTADDNFDSKKGQYHKTDSRFDSFDLKGHKVANLVQFSSREDGKDSYSQPESQCYDSTPPNSNLDKLTEFCQTGRWISIIDMKVIVRIMMVPLQLLKILILIRRWLSR